VEARVSAAVPFTIAVDEAVLADLRDRIARTRLPDAAPGAAWQHGTDRAYLKALLAYWADGFDWRAQERALNAFAHFRTELDGAQIHFVHERARDGRGVPLILTHGWPSAFVELLALVPLLTDPEAHGIDGPAFDVVIPSLPGYGFSERPARTGITSRYTAGLWHRLMQTLGYERYGAHGGDWGASVATFMALDDPLRMLGIHLGNLDNEPYTGPGSRPLTRAEQAYVEEFRRWLDEEHAYAELQATKPQTLAYALTDSPAGLAAWIVEKWRAWADSGGDVERRFPRDFLLTVVTLYWVTATIATSMRDYYDNRWSPETTIGPEDFVGVPTAIALFYANFIPEGVPPREWVERLYDVRRFTPMPCGGHFPAAEEPEALARDIAAFFGGLA
jgi:pimeloyl-ACP methyl ester carboxylesterase